MDPLAAIQKRDVHREWIRRNVPAGMPIESVLKTDLFEEAYGQDELLFSLPLEASIKIGLDLDTATVKRAADRERNPGCRFINADVRRLPLADESIDVVLSNSTLDHFDTEFEIEQSLYELIRVLKPGGILLVTLDNPRNLLFSMLRAAAPWMGLAFSLGKTLPLKNLTEILDRAGLELQSTGWLIHNPRFLSTLLFLLLRRLLGRRADVPIHWLLGVFARFGSLPTRPLTGVFVAACARKPAARHSSIIQSANGVDPAAAGVEINALQPAAPFVPEIADR